MMRQIFTEADANGDSEIIDHHGGEVEIVVDGPFDGATVTPMAKMHGLDAWVPISENGEVAAWTTACIRTLRTARRCQIKLVTSDAGAGTAINAWV